MSLDSLWLQLRLAGIQLQIVGDKLKCEAPPGVLSQYAEHIKEYKTELIARLKDPRYNDLSEDSNLWQVVLFEAKSISLELWGLLHGLRCGGCRLVRRENGSLKLDTSTLLEDWNETELRERWLMPKREGIVKALKAAEVVAVENCC
jgi:hypothetical protein